MPITFDLEPDQKFVIFRHVGEVADDEFLASYKDFFENPSVVASLNLLIDLEQTKSIAMSSQALKELAKLLREKLGDSAAQCKVALVAPLVPIALSTSFPMLRCTKMLLCPKAVQSL